MRIYFVGAQSTGKTTIARWTAERYDLPLLTEVVRKLKAEKEYASLDSLRVDLDQIGAFQAEIFRRQIVSEKGAGKDFVSDRGFDFMIYSAFHTLSVTSFLNTTAFTDYIETLRSPDAIVFYVRPHKELVTADHDRSPLDLRWEEICRIDGAINLALEMLGIPHIPMASLSMRERARMVERVISLLGKKDD